MTRSGRAPDSTDAWVSLAAGAGLLAAACYLGSVVFKPFPWSVGRLLFFAIGPLTVVSAVGLYQALEATASRVLLLPGAVLTGIGGAVVNVMAVVQDTQFTYFGGKIAAASSPGARESLEQTLWGVNVVQSGLDVSWDIFMATGAVLIGLAVWGHPQFGRVFGGLGIAAAAGALALNLIAFPVAPASAGLVDLGPAVALWYAALLVRLLAVKDRLGPPTASRPGPGARG